MHKISLRSKKFYCMCGKFIARDFKYFGLFLGSLRSKNRVVMIRFYEGQTYNLSQQQKLLISKVDSSSLYMLVVPTEVNIYLGGLIVFLYFNFLCRIDSIGSLEVQGKLDNLKRRQIALVDNDGVKLKFLLWNEQVILANLFR